MMLCPVCHQNPEQPEQHVNHDCIFERTVQRHLLAANVPALFTQFDWAERSLTELTAIADEYIDDLQANVEAGLSIVMLSPSRGAGKTTAACEILERGIREGFSAYALKFNDLLDLHMREDAEERMEWLLDCDLLLIDEVRKPRTEAQHDHFEQQLGELVDARYSACKSMFITGNIGKLEFEEAYESSYSRLTECAHFADVPGENFRPMAGQRRLARGL